MCKYAFVEHCSPPIKAADPAPPVPTPMFVLPFLIIRLSGLYESAWIPAWIEWSHSALCLRERWVGRLDRRSVQPSDGTWTEARRSDVDSTSSVPRAWTDCTHYATNAYLSTTTDASVKLDLLSSTFHPTQSRSNSETFSPASPLALYRKTEN